MPAFFSSASRAQKLHSTMHACAPSVHLSLPRLDIQVRINGSRVLVCDKPTWHNTLPSCQCILPVACVTLVKLSTGLGENYGSTAKWLAT